MIESSQPSPTADENRPLLERPIRLLLCEDTADDVRLIQEALAVVTQGTFEVTHVDRLSACLTHLDEAEVDIVLLDLNLPDSHGLETLTKVLDRTPEVPVVVLTASDDEALGVQTLKRGAQDYLVKGSIQAYRPLLGRAIRYAIERHRGEQLKDEFVSTVSHELRTPIATIQEFTAILNDQIPGPLTSDQREYLSIIQANVERLTRMIDNLLDMAKIEAGQMVLSKGVADIGSMLEQIVQSMRPLAKHKRVTIVADVPVGLPALYADTDKVTQVLMNLISNGIKFAKMDGRITVSAVERTNEIEFSVMDTGVGISKADLPKLFQKFQQIHLGKSVSGRTKGTGLGLAISKRLVELHGGRIWATSEVGKGSTFFFALPKYHQEELIHEFLKSAVEQAQQAQEPLSLVAVAVRNPHALKERFGAEHTVRLLKDVEMTLRGTVRRRDGGDLVVKRRSGEVVIVLAKTNQAGSKAMAKRIQHMVEEREFTVGSQMVNVEIDTATATYPEEGTTEEELLNLIEERLQLFDEPKVRIMVIDDEPKVRQLLREAFEMQQYDVYTAANGPDGLEQIKDHPVDLVLLDLMMPVMDGYEVYHLLKENPRTKDIPVIIITGKGERKDRQLGLPSATYQHIVKPFHIDEVLGKARELLQQQSHTT